MLCSRPTLATVGFLVEIGYEIGFTNPWQKVIGIFWLITKNQLSLDSVFVAWHSGNTLCPINRVALHRARLVLGWVTARRQLNHVGK